VSFNLSPHLYVHACTEEARRATQNKMTERQAVLSQIFLATANHPATARPSNTAKDLLCHFSDWFPITQSSEYLMHITSYRSNPEATEPDADTAAADFAQ
jgi:hypothetical protein